MEIKNSKRGDSPAEVQIQAVNEFIDLVAKGVSTAEASAQTGVSPRSAVLKTRLKELLALYDLVKDPEDRKKILIARMTELQLDPEASGSEAAAGARILIQDPDLGFNQTPAVQLNFSPDILTLPGAPKFREDK